MFRDFIRIFVDSFKRGFGRGFKRGYIVGYDVRKFIRKLTGNLFLFSMVILFLSVFALTVPVAIQAWNELAGGVVSANPVCNEHQPVPSRHIKTGKCQCMPRTENSGQWIPDLTCGIPWLPTPAPTETATLRATFPLPSVTVSPSATLVKSKTSIPPTDTLVPISTNTFVSVSTSTSTSTPIPAKSGGKIDPVVTSAVTLACDVDNCDPEQQKANALGTMAAVEVTRLYREMATSTPRP